MSDVDKSLRKLIQEETMLKESIEAAQARLAQIEKQRGALKVTKPTPSAK